MVRDLNFKTAIIGLPIVRDADGLAVSSRNVYLSDKERESALCLNKSFNVVDNLLKNGIRDPQLIKDRVREFITSFENTTVDYIEIVDTETLESLMALKDTFCLPLQYLLGKRD